MLEGSILQQLAANHADGKPGKPPLHFGVYYKNTLVGLCHALEDCILAASSAPLVITAFQRGKWYLQEADRYAALAEKARQVVILAAPDTGFSDHPTSQRPDVDLVPLAPEHPVAQEWHLMILSPSYTAMVLCQELSAADYGPGGPPREDRERKFYGFWTFEPELILETVQLAIAHIGQSHPALQTQLQNQVAAILQEMPHTKADDLHQVVSRVVDYLQAYQQSLEPVPGDQVLDTNLVSNELQAFLRLAQLVDLADAVNPQAAAEVTALTEIMAQLLDLPAWQVQRLRLASQLHRIGPLQGAESIFTPSHSPDEAAAPACALTCPLVPGAQVLRTMPRLRAIAQIIAHQSEWWNGSGQPAGLAGDDIPVESRILGLMATFQHRVASLRSTAATGSSPLTQALAQCQVEQGDRWDPKLVDALALLVSGMEQGLELPTQSFKVTAGLWLLDAPDLTTMDLTHSARETQ
jgi:DICT domain-containing protein